MIDIYHVVAFSLQCSAEKLKPTWHEDTTTMGKRGILTARHNETCVLPGPRSGPDNLSGGSAAARGISEMAVAWQPLGEDWTKANIIYL